MFQNPIFYIIAFCVFIHYRNKYAKKAKREIDEFMNSKNKKADS